MGNLKPRLPEAFGAPVANRALCPVSTLRAAGVSSFLLKAPFPLQDGRMIMQRWNRICASSRAQLEMLTMGAIPILDRRVEMASPKLPGVRKPVCDALQYRFKLHLIVPLCRDAL